MMIKGEKKKKKVQGALYCDMESTAPKHGLCE
jgi:hypothetical protein